MDRSTLKGYLDAGLSLDGIAGRTGKHPSTVSYWLRKHGLEANGAPRHAPKGGLRLDQLAPLVADGLPVREIARRLDSSQRTVRYWISKYGLPRPIEVRHADKIAALKRGESSVIRSCRHHGEVAHVIESSGRVRCRKCRQDAVMRWRRRVKARLVSEAGGACKRCGYDRYAGALEFHHLDPSTKEFGLSAHHITRSLDELRAEAAKCVLLCANCHAEVEAGVAELP